MSSPINKETLTALGKYLITGMTEEESCRLADISHSALQILKTNNEDVRGFVEKQKIRFKYIHLRELQGDKSSKNSQWLLEKLVPEFGPKAHNPGPTTVNIINHIMQEIQNDQRPIINAKYTSSEGGSIREGEKSDSGNQDQRLSVAGALE